jgi:hypothetical protein
MAVPTVDTAMGSPPGAFEWTLHTYRILLGRMEGLQITTAAQAGAGKVTAAPVAAPDRKRATSGYGIM